MTRILGEYRILLSYFVFLGILIPVLTSEGNTTFRSELDHRREPKQMGFLEWLFGPPVQSPRNKTVTEHRNSTVFSSGHRTHLHKIPHENTIQAKNSIHSEQKNETMITGGILRPEISSYGTNNLVDPVIRNNSTMQLNSSAPSFESLPFGPIFAKPRKTTGDTASIRSDKTESNIYRNTRQIQISDIQHAIGSEIDESSLNSDPSQLNLQDELDAIDRIEKNLTGNGDDGVYRISSQRIKRESTSGSKFRQLSIPYGGESASSNNRINTLSKRQLLLSPAEQQMLALRQQQDFAAATMLQQQQLLNNRNRYYNRYIDDYYDDDSSYEDSDEFFDDFNRYGLHNPLGSSMRRGVIPPVIPPLHHPMGLGRRSVPDSQIQQHNENPTVSAPVNKSKQTKAKANIENVGYGGGHVKRSTMNRASPFDSVLGPISKEGRWGTIEDYDLSSDFNKNQARKKRPMDGGNGSAGYLGESHKELDEEDATRKLEMDDDDGEVFTHVKQRSGLGLQRQGDVNTTTTEDSPTAVTETPVEFTMHNESVSEETTGLSSTTTMPDVTVSEITSTNASTIEPEPAVATTTIKPKPTVAPSTSTTTPISLPPFHQTLNCRCGMQSVQGHEIAEGTTIRAMVNPWLVVVRTKQKHLCSGSIINNKYILTSKSCVKGVKGLLITAGVNSRSRKNFTVIHINTHKRRNMALLKIKPAISPNHAMRPICLPLKAKGQERLSHVTGTLVTFKRTSGKRNAVGLQLVQTEVPLLSSTKCSTAGEFPSSSICHGPPGSMKCGGDSGGLLQVYQQGYSYEQIGVVSSTVGCRANKTPGIYTDVRKSVKWILYNTKDARYCRKPKVTQHDLMNAVKFSEESDESEEFEPSEEEEEDLENYKDDNEDGEVGEQWGWGVDQQE